MSSKRPMTKSQIVEHLSKKTDTTKKLAVHFLEELVSLAHKEAKKSFVLPGLGKLVLVQRKKRMGRNPATGVVMLFPAKKVLKFRIAKAAKDAVLEKRKPVEDDDTGPNVSPKRIYVRRKL